MFFNQCNAQANKVTLEKNNEGTRLIVNGKDFMVNGMNWDYFPIGTNFNYSLWKQSESVIKQALDDEMCFAEKYGSKYHKSL